MHPAFETNDWDAIAEAAGDVYGEEFSFRPRHGEDYYAPEEETESVPMVKDPVCGMEVGEKAAAATSQYEGKTYYFCAPGCKKAFDTDPGKYPAGSVAH